MYARAPYVIVVLCLVLCLPLGAFADTCFEEQVTGGEGSGRRTACFSAQRARFDLLDFGVIIDLATGQDVVLYHADAQYTSVPHQQGPSSTPPASPKPQRVVTAEHRSVAGFEARKVEWRIGGKTVSVVYYAEGPPVADVLAFKKALGGSGDLLPWPELDQELGYPVRIERSGQVIELVRVNSSPPAETFQAPKTYKSSPAALQRLRQLVAPLD